VAISDGGAFVTGLSLIMGIRFYRKPFGPETYKAPHAGRDATLTAMDQRALITGITGQDGSYLAELLLSKGYEVHGAVRRVALEDPEHRLIRLSAVRDRVVLHAASLESFASVYRLVAKVAPDECYHLAAQSFVSYSFDDEFSTLNTNINGTHFLLSAIRDLASKCRFYFAGSSEMFGKAEELPQTERTRFHPRSSYGISKVCGFELTRNYREAYGLHASSGIMFNHESPRRGFEFVTRKITAGVARILAGRSKHIPLGNLEARRDWGHAREYVQAMWLMLQQPEPDDYVVATGETHSVREFADLAFSQAGLDYRDHVVTDPTLFRPAEVNLLLGDATKARTALGWIPGITFESLVREMVDADCRTLGLEQESLRSRAGRHA
jgi:GDPmannose 4,6-dehydratase